MIESIPAHLRALSSGTLALSAADIVYFTSGSMTQNSTQGSMTESPVMNHDMEHKGCFTLWEKLAKKSDDFGRPEKFISAPDKSNFVSFVLTVKDCPGIFRHIEEKTGNVTGAGGATAFVDSSWYISFNAPFQPEFPDQTENIQVLWGYGRHAPSSAPL